MAVSLKDLLAEAKREIELVSPDELEAQQTRDEPLLLDVREKPEYEAGHLPGATQVSRAFQDAQADGLRAGRVPGGWPRGVEGRRQDGRDVAKASLHFLLHALVAELVDAQG